MSQANEFVDLRAALSLRARLALVRVAMMAAIALMLWAFAGWAPAPFWWAAYAALQYAIAKTPQSDGVRSRAAPYGLTFAAYMLAGFPAWHLWTHLGDLGIAAATMFLCGMLVQLVVSSLGARGLFWVSAGPLVAYLVAIPPLAFGATRLVDGLVASGCAILFTLYMTILWVGQQRALSGMEASRHAAEKARQEAEAASQAKTDFLAAMSHELRTPMNAVLGAADLLGRTSLSADQRDHVTMLKDGGAILMHVLNDVLDLAKIEAGKLAIDPIDTDVHDFVRRCAALWAPRAHDKGLEFSAVLPASAPRHLVFDAARVGQIVFNLLSNAVKFTETGSVRLVLETEESGPERCDMRICVHDTGIGMNAEARSRLFTAFEQADGSISRRFGGTGLGLSISQRLAQMMGGSITVQSAEGDGSSFVLTVPCALGRAEDAHDDDLGMDADPRTASARILVAEDNLANQRIINLFLEPIGAQVTIVGDGRAAVDALMAEEYDLVLMDMQMPIMDGLEATRRLRAQPGPNRDIPVLALTANVMDAQRRACVEAGMNGHIAKPIDARLLLADVLRALTGAPDEAGSALAVAAEKDLTAATR